MEIKDEHIRKKISLIEKNDNKIRNIKFAELLSLLNQGDLDDKSLYEFLDNTKSIIFSYFDDEQMLELYNKAMAKNSNLLRKIGNIRISFKDFLDKFKQKNNIANTENSNEYRRLYEICDLAFYANKVTKTICLPCLNYLAQQMNIEELDELYQNEVSGNVNFGRNIKSRSQEFQENYQMYRLIKRAENVCYAIKDASIRKMLDILYKDNYNQINTWGFFNDNRGNKVFAIDFPYELGGTFQFHIPDENTTLPKYITDNSNKYVFHFRDIVKNHPKHISIKNITAQRKNENMQELSGFKRNEERLKYYFAIANNMDVFSIFNQPEPQPENQPCNIKTFSSDELKMRETIIEQLKKKPKIAIQQGNNLDINASIYAIQKFLIDNGIIQNKEELEVVRIKAGMFEPNALNIDTGSLNGIAIKNLKINADENLGEKSACSILARLGFYVPKQIIENADVVYDKKILNSRYGLVLARQLKDEKLFEFAESIRKETGEPLITSFLTDDEIQKFGLTDFYQKRKKDIDEAQSIISENIYYLPNNKKIAIIPRFLNYGSFIAYSQKIDYYCSIGKGKENAGITFAITSNPHTGNGKLPKELIDFGYALRSQYSIEEFDSGVFVSQNYDKIIAGGPKNQDFTIYANMDSNEALEQFINDLKIKLGIQSKKELPNILSNVKSLGYDSRISALKKMNTDIERQEIIEQKGVEQDEQR